MRSLLKKLIPRSLFQKIAPAGHLVEAILYNIRYGFPSRGIKVIGITGTNGKTTTSFLVHRMLHESGLKVGLMTTVAYGVGDNITPQVEHMTTASVPVLLRRIKAMKKQGIEYLVLETTSHALAQHRVWSMPYTISVLTNLTHEHLDYHGTFERYRTAKRMMFKQTNRNRRGLRIGVVNADDPSAEVFASAVDHPIRYGIEHGDVRATDIKLNSEGVQYAAELDGKIYHIKTHLPGSFNVYNSLAAVCVGRALGLSEQQIEQGIAALKGVEGRMTRIDEGQPFNVIVDYAHTPDSFEQIFKDLRPAVKGKLLVLFGSAGRRDEAKRAVQGKLAGQYADEVIITEEDDRDMDGQAIMEEIAAGAIEVGKTLEKNVFMVHDRAEAIQFAINRAHTGDTLLLLGKGHEKDILRNGPRAAELRHLQQDDRNPDRVIKIHWDEAAAARTALKHRLAK